MRSLCRRDLERRLSAERHLAQLPAHDEAVEAGRPLPAADGYRLGVRLPTGIPPARRHMKALLPDRGLGHPAERTGYRHAPASWATMVTGSPLAAARGRASAPDDQRRSSTYHHVPENRKQANTPLSGGTSSRSDAQRISPDSMTIIQGEFPGYQLMP